MCQSMLPGLGDLYQSRAADLNDRWVEPTVYYFMHKAADGQWQCSKDYNDREIAEEWRDVFMQDNPDLDVSDIMCEGEE